MEKGRSVQLWWKWGPLVLMATGLLGLIVSSRPSHRATRTDTPPTRALSLRLKIHAADGRTLLAGALVADLVYPTLPRQLSCPLQPGDGFWQSNTTIPVLDGPCHLRLNYPGYAPQSLNLPLQEGQQITLTPLTRPPALPRPAAHPKPLPATTLALRIAPLRGQRPPAPPPDLSTHTHEHH